MKIGILTYHAGYNFGANLQALSTVNYLKNAGHDPIIINFFPKLLEEAYDKAKPLEQANAHKNFVKEHFPLTRRCHNAKEVAEEIENNNIQAVIIGSDAVVQHYPLVNRIKINPSRKRIIRFYIQPIRYELNYPNPFWGEFIEYLDKKMPVAMMSVSCQNTDYIFIRGKTRQAINKSIKKLSYISVRDRRTQELFKHVSNGSSFPKISPDPVFAFNENVTGLPSKNEIIHKFKLPDKYILMSFHSSKAVSKTWLSAFESIANEKGYQCVALAMPEGIKFDNSLKYKVDIPLDPIDWYSIIKYSSAYIGDNMHPIIVSLHNSVPCFSFDHYGILRFKFLVDHKTSKIYQILEKANFTRNRISVKRQFFYKPPTPEFVFDKIEAFDIPHCKSFSNSMLLEYNSMMQELLTNLHKRVIN